MVTLSTIRLFQLRECVTSFLTDFPVNLAFSWEENIINTLPLADDNMLRMVRNVVLTLNTPKSFYMVIKGEPKQNKEGKGLRLSTSKGNNNHTIIILSKIDLFLKFLNESCFITELNNI